MYEDKNDSLDTVAKSASVANNIKGAVKTGKSVSVGAKGIASSNPYGMAVSMLIQHRSKIIPILFCFLFPILFILLLPTVIFDGVMEDKEIPILNNDIKVRQNIQQAEIAVWSILKESHDAVVTEINNRISELGENETGIVEDNFSFGTALNSVLILSQYSASKNYDEINIDDLIRTVSEYQEQFFTYTETTEIQENEEGEEITIHHYEVTYIGDTLLADLSFHLNEEQSKTAGYYSQNLMLYLYGADYGMGGGVQVSQEVLQYSDLIRKYAQQYGISEYFNLICAVMMAESGGRVPDVMQASECPYNTKYPRKPNAIDNPEYSIDCGVHYLSDCLRAAGSTSPNDTGNISLALQGYNFGNGYINWALKNYGGYSESNAQEFSDMMKKKLGWSNYGNPRYVADVMRYYIPAGGNSVWGSPFVGRNWITAVTSEFGNRTDPINGKPGAFHDGLDIAFPIGTPIHAVGSGTVIRSGDTGNGFGLHIMIDHGNGIVTLYGHCSKLLVNEGQQVMIGQVIAEVGKTGRVTGAHLHLSFIIDGEKRNPREFLPTN